MVGNSRDIATRSLVVALKTPCFGKTTAEVVAITGLPKSTVNRIYARAISGGSTLINDLWLFEIAMLKMPTVGGIQPSVQKRW